MDVAKLLETRGDDAPSGENMEYDPAYIDLELAAQHGEERQTGDKIIEAEEPDYGEVVKLAEAVLAQSHDIRAAVFFAEAALQTKGLKSFAEATSYIRGCLEQHWATCHPELDEDDDNDPTMRINAVQGLSGENTVLRSLRRAALTDSKMFGKISLRMIEMSEGTTPVPGNVEDVPDSAGISAAFQDTDPEVLAGLLSAANSAMEDIDAIDAVFIENTPGQGPNLEELRKILQQISRRIADATGVEVGGVEGDAENAGAETGAAGAAGAGAGVVGGINSSADVLNAIDKIIAYYNRAEPSSPVPMLLERARRLVGADFITVIKDVASQGKDQVYNIGGIKEEDTGIY